MLLATLTTGSLSRPTVSFGTVRGLNHALQPLCTPARGSGVTMLDQFDLAPPPAGFPVLLDAVDAVPRAKTPVLGPLSRTVRPPITGAELSIVDRLVTHPTTLFDIFGAALLAVGLYLGPDFLLAPIGLAANARVGYRMEAAVGRALTPNQPWLADRADGLASDAPPLVRLFTAALFVVAGVLVERIISTLGSDTAVFYLGASSCVWGGLYEVARPTLPTREVAERDAMRKGEFRRFVEARFVVGGPSTSCHESEVARAFRRFYPKYRIDRGISDAEIYALMRRWMSVPRTQLLPGAAIGTEIVSARTAAGFYKGISLAEEPDVGLG